MSDPSPRGSIDPETLATSLTGKERELSELARELRKKTRKGDSGVEAWSKLLEKAVVCLRAGAREASNLREAHEVASQLPDLPPEPDAPLPETSARSLASSDRVLTGHASVVPVSGILGFLSGMGKCGVLWVETEKEGFLVQLENGAVVYAQGDSPPKGQRLGEILVRHRVLTAAELQKAIQGASEEEMVLGAYMMKKELITSDELSKALAEQAQLIFHRMFAADDASYQFEDGKQMVESEDMNLNVIQLLLESARANDEAHSMFEEQLRISIGRPETAST